MSEYLSGDQRALAHICLPYDSCSCQNIVRIIAYLMRITSNRRAKFIAKHMLCVLCNKYVYYYIILFSKYYIYYA